MSHHNHTITHTNTHANMHTNTPANTQTNTCRDILTESLVEKLYKNGNSIIDPVDFARMINITSSSHNKKYSLFSPYAPYSPITPGSIDSSCGEDRIYTIKDAIESADTIQEQITLSRGLPLVFNDVTQRYSLDPNAHTVMRSKRDSITRPIMMLNINESKILKRRSFHGTNTFNDGLIKC